MLLQCWLQPAPAPLHAPRLNLATAVRAEPGPGAEPARAGGRRPTGCSPSPGSGTTCLQSNVSAQHPPARGLAPSLLPLPPPPAPLDPSAGVRRFPWDPPRWVDVPSSPRCVTLDSVSWQDGAVAERTCCCLPAAPAARLRWEIYCCLTEERVEWEDPREELG